MSRTIQKLLLGFGLVVILLSNVDSRKLDIQLGSGATNPQGYSGKTQPSTDFLYRMGLSYEFGEIPFKVPLWFNLGISASRNTIQWKSDDQLKNWTYYLYGLQSSLLTAPLRFLDWETKLGLTLHSFWVAALTIHDGKSGLKIEDPAPNGITALDLFLRQEIGPVAFQIYYNQAISDIVAFSGLKVSSYGMDLLIPLLK